MPKSDTWPGGVPMDSLISNDSAGSCDSVISRNSGFSDDSLEYLSAEEKACLMFLEETIESLELEEDSGLSNDEPDAVTPVPKVPHASAMMVQSTSQGESSFKYDVSGRDQISNLSSGISTPLLHAKAVASLPPTNMQCQHKSPQPMSQTDGTNIPVSDFLQAPGTATEHKDPSAVTVAEIMQPAIDGCDGPNKSERFHGNSPKPDRGPLKVSPEGGTSLIPPPSDFMDEPEPKPQPALPIFPAQALLPNSQLEGQPTKASAQHDPPCTTLETHQTPSNPTVRPPVRPSIPPPPLEVPQSPPADSAELKSPPAVAPKPKKLPSNIILKSHKASVAGGADGGAHSSSSATDHVHMDPQKVRKEALIKLGLLKADQGESHANPGPVPSPNFKRRGTAPPSSSHSSRVAAHQTMPAPLAAPVKSPATTPAPAATSSLPEVIQEDDFVAPPPLFSDSAPAPPTHTEPPSFNELPGPAISVNTLVETPSPSPPLGVKSVTLEHTDVGLGCFVGSQGSSKASPLQSRPDQQRNSRPRPASLGSGKDFQGAMNLPSHLTTTTSTSSIETETGRALTAPQAQPVSAGGDSSQKMPRSHGISVLICPSGKSEEERRKALRRLGLIKD